MVFTDKDFIFSSSDCRTLHPVPLCLKQRGRRTEGQRWQKEHSQDLLWHTHTQADHSDNPRAEADHVLQSAYDHLIKQRSHLHPPGSRASFQPQWALQGTAWGQTCELRLWCVYCEKQNNVLCWRSSDIFYMTHYYFGHTRPARNVWKWPIKEYLIDERFLNY